VKAGSYKTWGELKDLILSAGSSAGHENHNLPKPTGDNFIPMDTYNGPKNTYEVGGPFSSSHLRPNL
jgi:hypothetical protein